MRVVTKDKPTRASPTIDKLIAHFEMSNLADGKSPKTIIWYRDILKLFLRYLKENMHSNSIGEFNIENARNYVLYLRSRNKFGRYINTHYSTLDFRHRLYEGIFVDSKRFPRGCIESNTLPKTGSET